MIRMPRPGPGKGCRMTDSSASPNSRPKARTSSLKSSRRGSMSSIFILAGKPPTLWCVLMTVEGPFHEVDSMTSGYNVPWSKKHSSGFKPICLTAVSKQSMNNPPMIFRFFSGSETPLSAAKNSSFASMTMSWRPSMWLSSLSFACFASSRRSRPVSTMKGLNRLPMELCTSAAATEESTPPLTAPTTYLSPILLKIESTCTLAKSCMFQVPAHPQRS
mmetsp:Transcript_14947/g.37624  ORF Transcript_14947/g.37624 Transcript_14947/m.37624 type:complete len:218 (-) Transcript_14947:750-1403(-)